MKMTISVPSELRDRMKLHSHVNWSAEACDSFERTLVSIEADGPEKHGIHYASEKLGNAMGAFRAPLPIRERLFGAYIYDLIHVPTWCLPDDVRPDFEAMMAACARSEFDGPEGTARHTIDALSEEEIARHVETVARTADAVERRWRQLFGVD